MASPRTRSISSPPDFPRPLTTVDLAIFTVREQQLQALLVQRPHAPGEPFPGLWALPGGFVDVDQDRDLEACARRKLRDKTAVTSSYLEQLGSWGSKDRDPRGWSTTHAYFALIPDAGKLTAGANAAGAAWFPIVGNGVKPKLAFDHREILETAIERLRSKVEYTSLPVYLLPREFTMTELQRVFEIVLGREVEKSAFRTRVFAADFIEPVPRMREGQQRPAQIYRLKQPSGLVFFPRTFSPRSRRQN
jgi:ADP-ribose pyrophosphatase YjhB (NUDIX family)